MVELLLPELKRRSLPTGLPLGVQFVVVDQLPVPDQVNVKVANVQLVLTWPPLVELRAVIELAELE